MTEKTCEESALYQFFSKPDRYFAPCGDLRCWVTECRVPDAPAFMRGLRALFISDVHAIPRTTDGDMAALVDRAAALKPDIVLLGGDYADRPKPALRLLNHLSALRAPLGIYAVLGNNDREAFPDISELRAAMAAAGIALLVNEARSVSVNGGTLIVAGLDEHRRGRPDATGLYPTEPAEDRYRLLLSHYPRMVDPMPDLMLSGHTHGGQFNLLGVTPYTIGFERIVARRRASRFVAGLHDYRGAQVLVSKGIGASRIPLRIGVQPEINLIRFD